MLDAAGTEIGRVGTDDDGPAVFDNVSEGDYTVAETRAPSGYIAVTSGTKVTVTSGQTVSLTFINRKEAESTGTGGITVRKVGGGQVLAGAEFSLYDGSGGLISTAVTGDDGAARFVGLAPGNYKILETSAPIGFSVYPEPLICTVGTAQALSCTLTDRPLGNETGVLGWSDVAVDNPQPADGTLPKTGGVPVDIFILFGGIASLLSGFAIFWSIKPRKNK